MTDVNELVAELRWRWGYYDGARSDTSIMDLNEAEIAESAADMLESLNAEVESLQGALSATDDFRIADWQKLEAERDDAESEAERLRAELVDETKRAEVERLRMRVAVLKRLDLQNIQRKRELMTRAERAEDELLRARAIPELLRHENATLTAQLQAVRRWRAEEIPVGNFAVLRLRRLDAILDAAADGATDE